MCDKSGKLGIQLPCLESDCLCHHHQIANESIHAKSEENSKSKFEESTKDMESLVDEKNVELKVEGDSSFMHAVINMIGMLIGLGQLSTPYALEKGGWTSAFLLVGLGIISAYSAYLLGKCLQKNPKSKDYKDIGQHAYGNKGRLIAATFIYLEIFMALVSYTISLHDNLALVFLGTHLKISWIKLTTSQILTVFAIFVAIPSLWLRDLSSISFLSTAGILMSLVIFVTVACTAIFGNIRVNHGIPALDMHNISAVSGLYMFSYGGHIVFPNIYSAMKDRSKFTKVSIVSFSIVTILYTTLAFMGSKMFGPQINSQITLSMPKNLIFTKIALWATVLTPMTKYALEFAPFAIQLEHNLPPKLQPLAKKIIRGGVGSILLLLILVLALCVPYFNHVLSLTGSLVSVGICVVFPCAFYTKIFWNQISKGGLILNGILIAIGTLMGVSGTFSSSKMLINSLRTAHHSA